MFRLRIRDLEKHQVSLVRLLEFAHENGFVPPMNGGRFPSSVMDEFVNLFTSGSAGTPLTRQELTRLTSLTQEFVRLPVYTTEMAAAWLGVGIDALRQAIWKSDPPTLRTFKMGHDRLIEHGELVRFSSN